MSGNDGTKHVMPTSPLSQLLSNYRSRATKLDDMGDVKAAEEVRECADKLEDTLGTHHEKRTIEPDTERAEEREHTDE